MGLDMYLTRKVYIGQRYKHRNIEGAVDIRMYGGMTDKAPIPLATSIDKLSTIEYDLIYWRKDNAIHNWFVKNVQDGTDDCETYWVSEEQLRELLATCRKVIEILDAERKRLSGLESAKTECIVEEEEGDSQIEFDPALVEHLLPPVSGFFFGGTAIDDWYIQGLKDTIKGLEDELENDDIRDERGDYYYTSSW